MQIKNQSILRVALLAGSVFTCLVFRSTGLAAPPVTYSYPPVTSRIPVPLVKAIPGPDPTRPFNARSAYGTRGTVMGVCRLQRRRSYRHTGSTKFRF
jgi:hypothetical protein